MKEGDKRSAQSTARSIAADSSQHTSQVVERDPDGEAEGGASIDALTATVPGGTVDPTSEAELVLRWAACAGS